MSERVSEPTVKSSEILPSPHVAVTRFTCSVPVSRRSGGSGASRTVCPSVTDLTWVPLSSFAAGTAHRRRIHPGWECVCGSCWRLWALTETLCWSSSDVCTRDWPARARYRKQPFADKTSFSFDLLNIFLLSAQSIYIRVVQFFSLNELRGWNMTCTAYMHRRTRPILETDRTQGTDEGRTR